MTGAGEGFDVQVDEMRATGDRLAGAQDRAAQAATDAAAIQLSTSSFGVLNSALGAVAVPLPEVASDILTALSRATEAFRLGIRAAADEFENADLESASAAKKREADLDASDWVRG
jgi:hypothetical protein